MQVIQNEHTHRTLWFLANSRDSVRREQETPKKEKKNSKKSEVIKKNFSKNREEPDRKENVRPSNFKRKCNSNEDKNFREKNLREHNFFSKLGNTYSNLVNFFVTLADVSLKTWGKCCPWHSNGIKTE